MKKSKIIYIFINFLLIILFMIFYYMELKPIVLFIINFIVLLEIVLDCKISIFSLKALIINYVLCPLLYQYIYGDSYGLLEMNLVTIHYSIFLLTVFLYNISTFLFLQFCNYKKDEKEKLTLSFKIKDKTILFICILTIACCIIAFPTLPFSYNSSHRFEALLPGNAWNHIVLICLIFMLGNVKHNKMVIATYLFSIFWFLSHYERVDILGLFCLLLLVFFNKKINKFNIIKIAKVGIVGIILLSVMLNIGFSRGGYKSESILKNIVVQSTASDIAYVYNISIDYILKNNHLYGKSYKQFVVESIPLLNYKNSIPKILSKKYVFPGGEYILSAPLMNFGVLFIPLFAIIENLIIIKIIKSKKHIIQIIYLFIIAASFRINWYGLSYIETGLLYIVPLLYFMYNKIFKSLVFGGDKNE